MFKYQVFLCCFLTLCAAERVHFSACGVRGFSCIHSEITYECPSDANDTLLLMNDFASPPDISTLIIKNCKELTISFQCSRQARNINFLHIQNIATLKIQQDPQYHTQLPRLVILEDINYMENIPSFSFSQIDKSSHNVECFKFEKDFMQLELKNVRIGTVYPNGINMPNDFGSVFLTNVTINRLKNSAILIKMSDWYVFQIKDSSVGLVETGAIQVSAMVTIFKNNTFGDISSNCINGTVNEFFFYYNSVNILQPYAISIISPMVSISENTFEFMTSRALGKIRPGPLSYNSGKTFTFKFFSNEIKHMEAECLQPDLEAYEQVPNNFFVKSNKIMCSCENSAWLFSETGHGYDNISIKNFYNSFLDEDSINSCSNSACNLPVIKTKAMIRGEKCLENVTIEHICQRKDELHPHLWVTPTVIDITNRISVSKSSSQILIVSNFLLIFVTLSIRAIHWYLH